MTHGVPAWSLRHTASASASSVSFKHPNCAPDRLFSSSHFLPSTDARVLLTCTSTVSARKPIDLIHEISLRNIVIAFSQRQMAITAVETTATEPPSRRNDTGLTNSTHSSSSSAERYHLDEFDRTPILLYNYHGGLETSSQEDLCARLSKDESLRVTKKTIPRATSYVDIKRHDLYLPDEKEGYAKYPNYNSSLASVKIPSMAYWSRLLWGSYDKLYIVSPERSATSSVADSDSLRASPTSTWAAESRDSAASQ